MMSTMLLSVTTLLISIIMLTINTLLYKKMEVDREKSSPFECGFDPNSSSRIPFSLKFFLIAVIFLIFDVEIALMLPMMPTMNYTEMNQWIITTLMFIILLIVGLYHEWNQGALKWME